MKLQIMASSVSARAGFPGRVLVQIGTNVHLFLATLALLVAAFRGVAPHEGVT